MSFCASRGWSKRDLSVGVDDKTIRPPLQTLGEEPTYSSYQIIFTRSPSQRGFLDMALNAQPQAANKRDRDRTG